MRKHLMGPQLEGLPHCGADIMALLCPRCQEQLRNTVDTQYVLLICSSLCSKFLQKPRSIAVAPLEDYVTGDGAGKPHEAISQAVYKLSPTHHSPPVAGEVVQVGVAHHLLVGHIGSDEAVAIEGHMAHRVPVAVGNSTVRLGCSLLQLRTARPSKSISHCGKQAGAWPFSLHLHPVHFQEMVSTSWCTWDVRTFNRKQTHSAA